MRKLFGIAALIAAILSLSFIESTSDKVFRPKGEEITIEWGVVENNYAGKTLFLSELSLVNNSEHTLATSGWTLYFSFNACRPINTDSLPDIVNVEHINGDFFKMTPSAKFPGLEKGKKITIPIVSAPWAIKNTDVPGGFYFVFDDNGKSSQPEASPFVLTPGYTTKKQMDKTPADNNPIWTAADVFKENEKVDKLSSSETPLILPTPTSLKMEGKEVKLTSKFKIVAAKSLHAEAKFLSTALKQNLGSALNVVESAKSEKNAITLKLGKVKSESAEAYELIVDNKSIVIIGNTNAGVFYGVQSLRALLPVESFKTASAALKVPAVKIMDEPGLSYRGMHLDVVRNFQSKESVLRLLDVMALYKLNKFHFHIIDDEGWRLEIKALPELTEVGSKRGHTLDESDMLIPSYGSGPDGSKTSGSGYYTRAEFIEILKYAKERHIEVIPELDMPGHARAAIKSMNARYKKYMAQGNEAKAKEFLLTDFNDSSSYSSVQIFNDNVICACQSSTYKFLETVLDDMISMYKEADAPLTTIHSGGDEVPHGVWEKSPVCNELIASNKDINNVKDIKEYFLSTFSEMITSRGLTFAGWEEIGMHIENHDGKEIKEINPKYAGQFTPYIWNSVYGWGGEEIGYKMANSGYQVVLCNVTNLYFDLANDKRADEPGFYWGGFVNLEKTYLFEPFNVYNSIKVDLNGNEIPQSELDKRVPLSKKGKENIYGIQGQLWSETVMSPERLDYMIYPRLIALGERAWNPKPSWSNDDQKYKKAYNEFVNTIGQRDLPRLDYFHGGVSYRIPTPGAKITDGTLTVNTEIPGFVVRYTTDGTEPNETSMVIKEPTKVEGNEIKIKAFASNGRSSRTVLVK